MKNLKVFITAIAITFFAVTTVSATSTETTSKNQLRTELIDLLGSFEQHIDQASITANVAFMLNNNNEIVVMSVDSDNKSVVAYVKSRLNYKKVNAPGISKGEVYVMPLKIEKGE